MDRLLNIMKYFICLKKQGILCNSIKNVLDKSCFDHDAAYSDSKDLAKRTISDKILNDGAYEINIYPKDHVY